MSAALVLPVKDGLASDLKSGKEAPDFKVTVAVEVISDKVLTPKVLLTLAAISVLILAFLLDSTGPSGIVSYIVADVGGQADAIWVVNTTNLLQAAAGPPLVYLSDIFGRRKILLVALLPGIFGPFISATATGLGQVIGGQVLTGIALSSKPLCHAIASEVVPRRWRGLAQTWITFLSSVGGLIGAVAGPAFISRFGTGAWRDLFFITGALFAVGAIIIAFCYSPPSRQAQFGTSTFRLQDLDFVGWLLMSAGLTLFLIGLDFGGAKFPWNSAQTLAPLLTGCLTLVAFGVWEWRYKTDGLMAHSLFKERNFALSLLAIFIEAHVVFAVLSQYSQETLRLFNTNSISQAEHLIPFWLTGLLATVPLGFIAHKVDPRPVMIGGFALYLIAAIMLATVNADNGAVAIAADAIAGIAFAPVLTLLIVVAQLCTPPLLIGTATALLSTARALGSAVGTAIFAAIYSNKFSSGLTPAIVNVARANGLKLTPALITAAGSSFATANPGPLQAAVPGISPGAVNAIMAAGKTVVADAFKVVWISVCAFIAVAIIAVACMKSVKAHLTNTIDSPIEVKKAPFAQSPITPVQVVLPIPGKAPVVPEKVEKLSTH